MSETIRLLLPAAGRGLTDFWTIYQAHAAQLSATIAEVARSHPGLGPALEAAGREEPGATDAELREVTRRAFVEGEWEPYLASLRALGTAYARHGVVTEHWVWLTAQWRRALLPLLMQAYGDDPQRLSGVLDATVGFTDLAVAAIGAEFVEAKQRVIREQQQAAEERAQELARIAGELRQRTELLHQVLENTGDAVRVVDAEGRTVHMNRLAEQLTGVDRDEQVPPERLSEDFRVFRPDGVTPMPSEELPTSRALRGLSIDGLEMVLRNPRLPEPILVRCSARPLRDERGDLWGAVAFFRDVSQERRLEQVQRRNRELEEAEARMREANRLKSEFLANMSHELRTPLNAIIGFAELVQDGHGGPVTAETREYLGDILASGRHLLGLINDVLDLAKIEAGKLEFRPSEVDPADALHEVAAILREIASKKRIRVEIEGDPSLGAVVADPGKLKQVLYNYLSNALKFTPEGGRVVARARAHGSDAFVIEVEDSGPGVRPEDVARLFREFEQLDGGQAKRHPGTGLGLALCKRIVEAQGGHVGMRPAPGGGSLFFAQLPRFTEAPHPEIAPAAEPAPLNAARILVVEDDPHDRAYLTRTLVEAGYWVDAVGSGREALAAAESGTFDAVTLDLLLPDGSGWDVLLALRRQEAHRDVPVIVVSVVAEEGIAAGFPVQDVLQKPLAAQDLLSSLERLGVRPGGSRQILAVDDDPSALKLLGATLSQLGFAPALHTDAASALDAAAHDPPAAIVLDLLMPGMDGFEFLDRLRSTPHGRQIPVIVWTVKDLSRDEYDRLRRSAQGVVLKKTGGTGSLLETLRAYVPPPARRG